MKFSTHNCPNRKTPQKNVCIWKEENGLANIIFLVLYIFIFLIFNKGVGIYKLITLPHAVYIAFNL